MAERLCGWVWRQARTFLGLAIVAALVSGDLLVKVRAAAGDLDPTFSTDGKQRTVFGRNGDDAFGYGVAIQADGKVVVAGQVDNRATGYDFGVARYNTDGTPDTTFSDDGKQTTSFSRGYGRDQAYDVAVQADGKIVVVGSAEVAYDDFNFGVVRYNTDGTLDTTFSEDGKQTTDFPGHLEFARGVVIQRDGKIVVGGGTLTDFALARYNPNGTLDTTFSGDGKQTTDFSGGDDRAYGMALQPNGKIVLAGFANGPTDYNFALARYNTNGTLDANFGTGGKLYTPIGTNSLAYDVAIQPNGKIVASGYAYNNSGNADFALARYNGNGSLDDGSATDRTPNDMFGTGGIVTTDFFSDEDVVNAIAIQPDGKIVAAGSTAHANNRNYDFALARYNTDGTLDMSLGGDGRQTTDFAGGTIDELQDVAIQSDGKIVVAGFMGRSNHDYDFAVARYLGD